MTIEIRILHIDGSVRQRVISTAELLDRSLLDIFSNLKTTYPTIAAIRTDIDKYTWIGHTTVEHMSAIADMEKRGINW